MSRKAPTPAESRAARPMPPPAPPQGPGPRRVRGGKVTPTILTPPIPLPESPKTRHISDYGSSANVRILITDGGYLVQIRKFIFLWFKDSFYTTQNEAEKRVDQIKNGW